MMVWILLWTAFMTGCSGINENALQPSPAVAEEVSANTAEAELVALTDSEEAAKELAKLYGVELKSFRYGVAVFRTGEDPAEVIRRGQELGYPALELNQTTYIE